MRSLKDTPVELYHFFVNLFWQLFPLYATSPHCETWFLRSRFRLPAVAVPRPKNQNFAIAGYPLPSGLEESAR